MIRRPFPGVVHEQVLVIDDPNNGNQNRAFEIGENDRIVFLGCLQLVNHHGQALYVPDKSERLIGSGQPHVAMCFLAKKDRLIIQKHTAVEPFRRCR